jgi:hypothetical protein
VEKKKFGVALPANIKTKTPTSLVRGLVGGKETPVERISLYYPSGHPAWLSQLTPDKSTEYYFVYILTT